MTKMTIITIIGVAFLVAAAISTGMTLRFIRSSIVVPADVVALNAGGSHPQIAFVTRNGEQISYPQGGLVFSAKVGDHVEVRYLADSPKQSATLNQFGAIWSLTILLAGLGVGFVFTGLSNLLS
ncbi:DUF3592 domain-containing protein [Phyllobacterium sp. TAF24]|uniref:DUF3592 domain-containing protein n=1 Tax=Phyllobacterium sp. TAF24 TaxID=3233068 RepID=UPI003F9BA54F